MSNSIQRAARPIMVWFISTFYIIVGLGSLAFSDMALTMGSLPPTYVVVLIATGLLTLLGAVALVLLRRQAVPLFTLALAASVIMYAWPLCQPGGLAALNAGRVVGTIMGLSLMTAVLLYSRSLRKAAVLK